MFDFCNTITDCNSKRKIREYKGGSNFSTHFNIKKRTQNKVNGVRKLALSEQSSPASHFSMEQLESPQKSTEKQSLERMAQRKPYRIKAGSSHWTSPLSLKTKTMQNCQKLPLNISKESMIPYSRAKQLFGVIKKQKHKEKNRLVQAKQRQQMKKQLLGQMQQCEKRLVRFEYHQKKRSIEWEQSINQFIQNTEEKFQLKNSLKIQKSMFKGQRFNSFESNKVSRRGANWQNFSIANKLNEKKKLFINGSNNPKKNMKAVDSSSLNEESREFQPVRLKLTKLSQLLSNRYVSLTDNNYS